MTYRERDPLQQSIDADKVNQLALDRLNQSVQIQMSAHDWLWLGVGIDFLHDNQWLLRATDEWDAEEQILSAMASLHNYILGETMKIAIVFDQKPQNANGGTFTSGAWRQRDLNVKQDPSNIISISNNSITISESGNYFVRATAPAFQVVYHQLRLTKNSLFLAQGTSEYCTGYVQTRSSVVFCGALVAGDVIKLEHQCGTTVTDAGFGVGGNSSFGEEVFSVVEIIQF